MDKIRDEIYVEMGKGKDFPSGAS
ncbi:hypothetical protein CCP2SC5_90009 [Azospirillaceae bacterium]